MTWAGIAWYMTWQARNEGIGNAKYTEQWVKQRALVLQPVSVESQQNVQGTLINPNHRSRD
jgi:hypothetical protein